MLNDVIRKPDGSRISFYVNSDNTYKLAFASRALLVGTTTYIDMD